MRSPLHNILKRHLGSVSVRHDREETKQDTKQEKKMEKREGRGGTGKRWHRQASEPTSAAFCHVLTCPTSAPPAFLLSGDGPEQAGKRGKVASGRLRGAMPRLGDANSHGGRECSIARLLDRVRCTFMQP